MYIFFLSSYSLPIPKTRFLTPWIPFTSLTHIGSQYHILICLMHIQLTSHVLSVLKVLMLSRTAELDEHLSWEFTAACSRSCFWILIAHVLPYELARCFHTELRGVTVAVSSSAVTALNILPIYQSVNLIWINKYWYVSRFGNSLTNTGLQIAISSLPLCWSWPSLIQKPYWLLGDSELCEHPALKCSC